MPPDECIEIALWDRFGWGPTDTDKLTLAKLRVIFAIIEQQRATQDASENLGRPDDNRIRAKVEAMNREKKSAQKGPRSPSPNPTGSGPSNARVIRRQLNP
jgi:hypothetical protein